MLMDTFDDDYDAAAVDAFAANERKAKAPIAFVFNCLGDIGGCQATDRIVNK
jgi:hypothetical protein